MNNYRITMENIRKTNKWSVKGNGSTDTLKFNGGVLSNKIVSIDENNDEHIINDVSGGAINTTINILDEYDYPETNSAHGLLIFGDYLWLSQRSYKSGFSEKILKISLDDLSSYDALSFDAGSFGTTIDELIYANGYIWFLKSFNRLQLVRLDPNGDLSNYSSCCTEYDMTSFLTGIDWENSTLKYNEFMNKIFIANQTFNNFGYADTIDLINVVDNGETFSFTIQNYIIDFNDDKYLPISGFKTGVYDTSSELLGDALLPCFVKSFTISGSDSNVVCYKPENINNLDEFIIDSDLIFDTRKSSIITFNMNTLSFEDIIKVPGVQNVHSFTDYGNYTIFTSAFVVSGFAYQAVGKINSNLSVDYGFLPCEGVVMLPSPYNTIMFNPRPITDDTCTLGNYGYFGNEGEGNKSTIYKFNLNSMILDDKLIIDDVDACFATVAYDNNIYCLFSRFPGKIVILDPNLNILANLNFPEGYNSCNELGITDDGMYIPFFNSIPQKVIKMPTVTTSTLTVNPEILLPTTNTVRFDLYENDKLSYVYNLDEGGGINIFDETEEYTGLLNNDSVWNEVLYSKVEENFPYKILKGTTQYDPFSYISYDYMISTSRKAGFQAFIDNYFDDENFNFVNTLTRVGYRKDLYDNDITLYNHFYYSTEDDEDEFVRIELEDNTIKYDVGSTVTDKYGEVRTVSSREIVSEGISTIMCRIYEITDSGERIVYSGLIDKRETKFDGKELSVSLIDVMGLYVELAEKYNIVVGDISNSGVDSISSLSKISSFILFLRNNLNINNLFIPDPNDIRINTENVKIEESLYYQSVDNVYGYAMSYVYWSNPNFGIDGGFAFNSYIPIIVNKDDNDNITLSLHDMSGAYHNESFSFGSSLFDESSALMINMSNIKVYYPKKYDLFGIDNYYMDNTIDDTISVRSETLNSRRSKYGAFANLKITYFEKFINATNRITTVCIYPNIGIFTDNEYNDYYNTLLAKFNNNKIAKIEIDYTYNDFVQDTGDTFIYEYVKYLIENNDELSSAINDEIIAFEAELNSILNNYVLSFIVAETPTTLDLSIPNNQLLSNFITINDNPDGNDYNYLVKIESQKRTIINPLFYEYNGDTMMYYDDTILFTDTYIDTLPLYSREYSLYDITKLFSLTCYNKILTKDTGEMYFDKESYSENNGYIYIDKADIVNNYSQESMISDEESFDILDSVYVGTKYIKEAYKRLETSTKENYKKLYENNNMKVSFNLRNYMYDIKSNLETVIDTREIEPKDVIRIMNNGYVKIEVFVTSVKFINNNTEIQLEGITMPIRTASLQ